MIFGLSKALSGRVRVVIVDFGSKSSSKLVDSIPILVLSNRLRFERNRGLFLGNWNALTSAFLLFLSMLKGELPRRRIVLHFHHGAQFSIFWILQRLFLGSPRLNCVYSHHSPRWMDPTLIPLWQRVFAVASELFSIKHADFVTFESAAVTKGISKVWRLPPRYMILPNGVDVNIFDKNRFNVAEESFSLFYGARIKRQKDQLTVVRAMAIVLQVEPRARLLLLGDPEELDYYDVVRKEVLRLGLDGFVEFHPSVSIEKFNHIRAKYPVHLIYSCFTGLDVSLGETLSLGVACILSNIPPVNGIAIDGVNCLLIPPHNVEALATAMIKLLQDPDLRKCLGKGARLTAEEQLSWTGLSSNFIELLNKCTQSERKALR